MTVDRYFARHIVSWYAGVSAEQAARAERVQPSVIRAARLQLGRGGEFGGTRRETLLGQPPAGAGPGQLSLAGMDGFMRSNRSVCG
jgi:hypothetical protein